jgi:hypothetical protein
MSPMRLLVCGGRDYADKDAAFRALDAARAHRPVAVVIHGKCHLGGADWLAELWARERGIPDEPYPVDHAIDGQWPGAGPRRNARMLRSSKPDGVLALPGGGGTADMMRQAREASVKVWDPYAEAVVS